ncbi:MAG: tetratricopeptide repeat protein [Alkalispirochaeta sp.]
MKRRRSVTHLVSIVLALLVAASVPAQDSASDEIALDEILNEGLEAFRTSDFETAMVRFREILLEEPDRETEATAYFWLAKSAMATERLSDAQRNLEYYLRTFPEHTYAVEAAYQRGRLLFMQEDYAAAIEALNGFIDEHPESPFVANALYWSGESLYNLGRLDAARRVFQAVVRDYPRSFRVEAARYRTALIDLDERETELLELLRWSHEEYLQALDEFERREQAYQEAIASYQEQLTALQDGRAGTGARARE